MSDCSTQAMEPKKQQRTCGTCAHCEPCEWHCNVEENAHRWIVDIDDVGVPCKGLYYEDNPDSLPRRYERLAQVAREMFWCVRDPLDFVERTGEKYVRDGHYFFTEIFAEQLEELGVSVDGTDETRR